jgi:hypothetical protein
MTSLRFQSLRRKQLKIERFRNLLIVLARLRIKIEKKEILFEEEGIRITEMGELSKIISEMVEIIVNLRFELNL